MKTSTPEPAGTVAPAGEKSQQPAPKKTERTIVSCDKQRGWYELEVPA